MESFSSMVKSELCELPPSRGCCDKAELYGFALFSSVFELKRLKLSTESSYATARLSKLLYLLCGIEASITAGGSGAMSLYTVEILGAEAEQIAHFFGRDRQSLSLRIDMGNLKCKGCAAAFLRGVFLAAGSVNTPSSGYHLEIVTGHRALSEDLAQFLKAHSFEPRELVRKQNYVVYFKDSSEIEDFLTTIGAQMSALEVMSVKVYKDIRNNTNRLVNCETANIKKTVGAAARQCEAIEKLIKSGRFEQLSPELRTAAELRLENPECSLSELAEKLPEGLTKSGLNHRLCKLVELA